MRLVTLLTPRWVRVGMALTAITAVALPAVALSGPAGASPIPGQNPPTYSCPVVGAATGCGSLIIIGSDGSASFTPENGGAFDSSEDVVVGIINDSDALVTSVALSGGDVFGFDGDGICTYAAGGSAGTAGFADDSYCVGSQLTGGESPAGYDYQGPYNTFSVTDDNDGTVNFSPALTPGQETFFSLEEPPSAVGAVGLEPGIGVSGSTIAGTEGSSTGAVTVATFTDGPLITSNTSPPSDFSVSINWGDGSGPDTTATISQPGGSGSAYVVTDSHTYAEKGTYTTAVTVTDAHIASNTATGDGTATIAEVPLTPSATQPTIPNSTTNKSFTAVVGSFTDANPMALTSDFTTVINWGDGSPTSSGTVSEPGGIGTTFDVSGTHTYATNGTYTISVKVTDVGGSTAGSTATIMNTVSDYDAVITCSSSPCTGTATSNTQTTGASTTSTTGTILLDLNNTPLSGAFSCNDPFRHAPQYSTILENGLAANGSVDITITFANSAAGGFWLDPFAVCFKSPGVPFTDLFGHSVTLGLLPICPFPRPGHQIVGPCVQSIEYSTLFPLPSEKGTVTEQLIVPANDPLSH